MEIFGWNVSWVAMVAIAMVIVIIALAIRKAVVKNKSAIRHSAVRDASKKHKESILVCVRCVGHDATSVSMCLQRAIEKAASPLRLTFAIVQEDAITDVYEKLTLKLQDSGDGHDYAEKIRTFNILDSNGFMEALSGWQQLYRNETYVMITEINNMMLDNWDLCVVDSLKGTPSTMVVTAPGPTKFPVYLYGQSVCRYAPSVKGVTFGTGKDVTVSCIAASHKFACFHGGAFSAIRKASDTQCVPRYVVDAVFSDHLYTMGFRFVTPPATIFHRRMRMQTEHLESQRPRSWQRRYRLSKEYCKFAGLKEEIEDDQRSERYSERYSERHSEKDDNHHDRSRQRKDNKPPKTYYYLSERSKLGLTNGAVQSGEALQKYGTHSEISRRRLLVQRLECPF